MSTTVSERGLLALKHVARGLGIELLRFNPTNALDAQRARLIEREAIDLVLDVGANEGQWAGDLRRGGYRGALVSFEPLAQARAVLERRAAADAAWAVRAEALSDATGEAELHVAANLVSSSLLAMGRRHEEAAPDSRVVRTERVATARLDDLDVGGTRVMLKLDVQGGELRALDGAAQTLGRVRIVEAELSFEPLYDGAPAWSELVAALAARGFALAGIAPTWVDDASALLLQADALFVAR